MNVRKPANYNTMYREVAEILTQNLPQMDEIYAIGKAIKKNKVKLKYGTFVYLINSNNNKK